MKTLKDGWMWIPLLALVLGMAIPRRLANFEDESWQDGLWVSMFSTFAMLTWAIFKRVGYRMPRFRLWMIDSFWGTTLLAFIGAFASSGLAVLFATMPIPHWLSFVLGLGFALVALSVLVKGVIRS